MRMKLEERAIETKVKDDALVKQRREEIIRAASKIFTQKGYHMATIRNICEASGLGPGTLYNYIKKKEDILYLIYNKLTGMLTESLLETVKENRRDPLEQLNEALRKIVEIAWNYQELILLMYQETASLDRESMHHILKRESDFVSLMDKILEGVKRQGMMRGKKSRLDADIIIFLLAFIPLRRWNFRNKFSEEEIKAGLIDFMLRAVGVSSPKKVSVFPRKLRELKLNNRSLT
jgi:AcrR family transcriptional regulator